MGIDSISELQLQAQCYQWAYGTYPQIRGLLWHVPNETKPFPGEPKHDYYIRLNKMKAAGLVKGVSDLHFYWRNRLYCFELKVDYNKESTEQIAFGARIQMEGGYYDSIRTLEQFKAIFTKIITAHP
jgi:hypothetical protein